MLFEQFRLGHNLLLLGVVFLRAGADQMMRHLHGHRHLVSVEYVIDVNVVQVERIVLFLDRV